jgi:hypothetical protein
VSGHGRAWLAVRAGAVPPSLQARMESAVEAVAAAAQPDVPAELSGAAIACLLRAFEGCDERAAALHLLAADALMTSACEAAAGVDSADAGAATAAPAAAATAATSTAATAAAATAATSTAATAAAALDALCASVSLRRLSLLLPDDGHNDAMSDGAEQAVERRHD